MSGRYFSWLVVVLLLPGCYGYKMQYGLTKNGVNFQPLCEKAKSRITDMQRFVFDLPEVFKKAPCANWPDFSYGKGLDTLSVEVPGSVSNGEQIVVGSAYSMFFYGGVVGRATFYLNQDDFFQDHLRFLRASNSKKFTGFTEIIESGWVEHGDFKCARFYTETEHVELLRKVEYYCWAQQDQLGVPFLVNATQSLPPGSHAPMPLDKEFIGPVLGSLQLTPTPDQFQQAKEQKAKLCTTVKLKYEARQRVPFLMGDTPDQRGAFRFFRACGFKAPESGSIEKYSDLLSPGGKLIGIGTEDLRKVSKEEFDALVDALMSLRPRKVADRPKQHVRRYDQKIDGFVTEFYFGGGYSGDWYALPPGYEEAGQQGFGLRNDGAEGRVIEFKLYDYPAGFRVVSDK